MPPYSPTSKLTPCVPPPPNAHELVNAFLKGLRTGAIRLYEPFEDNSPIISGFIAVGNKKPLMGIDERVTLQHGLRHGKNSLPIWVGFYRSK